MESILPALSWLRSSAARQGALLMLVSVFSLVLMSSITITFVDYQLSELNDDIEDNIEAYLNGDETEIDNEPIDEDEIIAVLATGFILSGILVTIISIFLTIRITKNSRNQMIRIEEVLYSAANGEISARTGGDAQGNDLARIGHAMDTMLAQLQGAVTAMSDISANIAHELKTPITRLQQNLLTIKEKMALSNTLSGSYFDEQLGLSLKESQRLSGIFDALLRISQIESGSRRQRFEKIDVVDVLNDISEIYTYVAEDEGMKLCADYPLTSINIQGDKELLTQLFANLVENALRYCPRSTDITLSLCRGVSAVVVTVTDDGPGINDDEKKRVFERMYRVNKSRNDGGLGLGLSLAKAVVDLHNGEITLHDANPGLSIKITLPITN